MFLRASYFTFMRFSLRIPYMNYFLLRVSKKVFFVGCSRALRKERGFLGTFLRAPNFYLFIFSLNDFFKFYSLRNFILSYLIFVNEFLIFTLMVSMLTYIKIFRLLKLEFFKKTLWDLNFMGFYHKDKYIKKIFF